MIFLGDIYTYKFIYIYIYFFYQVEKKKMNKNKHRLVVVVRRRDPVGLIHKALRYIKNELSVKYVWHNV